MRLGLELSFSFCFYVHYWREDIYINLHLLRLNGIFKALVLFGYVNYIGLRGAPVVGGAGPGVTGEMRPLFPLFQR